MKKILTIMIGVLLLSHISVYSVSAITVNINEKLVQRQGITADTDWTVIDGSQFSPWEAGIRSLYIAMYTGMRSSCVGDGVHVMLRPFNDDNNVRHQIITSIHDDPENTDGYIQYVWLPLNSSNKLEYKVSDLGCTEVDLQMFVVGYDD
jgi:hypothetical protein